MSLSFKAYLYETSWRGNPIEIRRFTVDQDATTSYVYLVQKLTQVFPTVTTSNVSIAWTDNDGDLIAISSDEELVEALSHFDGVLFKLYLLKKNTASSTATTGEGIPTSTDHQQQQQQSQGQQSGPNRRHWGVVCDGCNGPVIGVRYKCLVCNDYDLCSACEGRGVHVNHNMVTINEPRWGRGHGPWGGPRRGCRGGPWGPPTGMGGCPLFWGGIPSSTGSACGGGKQPEPMETDQPTVTEEQKEQIRNIGKFVSNFLQPFGIKVDVDTSAGNERAKAEEKDQSSGGASAEASQTEVSAEVIEETLAQLKAMGHTDNEGGWLTELVKAKRGNISQVLDALHFTETD